MGLAKDGPMGRLMYGPSDAPTDGQIDSPMIGMMD